MSKNALRYPESAIAGGRFGTARVRGEIASAAARLESGEPAALDAPIARLVGKPAARSKYGNQPCVVEDITFDSKREAARYLLLAARQRAGEITNLRIQVPFILDDGFKAFGKTFRVWKYIADFVYEEDGETVIEDVKGFKTREYETKKRFMARQGLEIREIK